jgi:D-alanyl-D-alanine carboxypeptidase/D-alanyl-D-alanine-endopeptidase (penicillin-binding protein 4)
MTRFLLQALLLLAAVALPSAASSARPALEAALREEFANAALGEQARLGAVVTDLSTGARLVEIDAAGSYPPASLVKLFTTAAAVDTLGLDHRFTTELQVVGEIGEKGVLTGAVILRGGGDPAFGPRFQANRSDLAAALRHFARDLRSAGIRRLEGDVLADGSLFTGPGEALGWDPVDRGEWYAAPVHAMTFNDGCIDIEWDGSGSVGSNARGRMAPVPDFVELRSLVKIESPGGASSVRMSRLEGGNLHIGRGAIPKGPKAYSSTSVENPGRFTAHVLRHEMKRAGIKVSGLGRALEELPAGLWPEGERSLLARHVSPPLTEYLPVTLRHSQNLYAECLARAVAIERGLPASFEGAADALEQWIDERGLARAGTALFDGSGLSSLNRLAPRTINDLLVQQASPTLRRAAWRESLARPGQPGTLRDRLPGLSGRFSGKSGTLTGVHCLAGYVTLANGRELAVVLMLDGVAAPADQARAALDAMVARVAGM